MKKFGYLSAILAVGLVLTLTDCKKKKIDPCEGIVCEEGEKCVDGKCIEIKRK